MKSISFKYYMNLQIRFIKFKAYQLNISKLEVAAIFAIQVRNKLEHKYIVIF